MKKIQITKNITDRSDVSVNSYLASISKMTPLSAAEEVELSNRIQKGDRVALEKLIRSNLLFVVSVAKQFQSRGLELADLIEEGNIGLCRAAEKFDGSRGCKFITFAVNYIQQAILDALVEKGRLVRIPHGQVTTLNRIKDIVSRYEQTLHRAAELDEIAKELEMEPSRVKSILDADKYAYRLDAPLTEDSDAALSDFFEAIDDTDADAELERESNAKELDMILNSNLKERDAYVIRHTFGIGCEVLTQTEMAINLGLSRESIRQIRDKALLKLRDPQISMRLKLCS